MTCNVKEKETHKINRLWSVVTWKKKKKTYRLILNFDAASWERLRKTKQCGTDY